LVRSSECASAEALPLSSTVVVVVVVRTDLVGGLLHAGSVPNSTTMEMKIRGTRMA
jgi:hypothetical protein